jgi:autotransporter translocation and assembly factor TamB
MEKPWSAWALALMLLMAGSASADTAADAGTAVDRWAAAFNANDVDALVGGLRGGCNVDGNVGRDRQARP